MSEREEQGTLYESGRVVVQARAIAAVVNAMLEQLPPDARQATLDRARQSLDEDPGARKILEAGLHIERELIDAKK